MLKIYKTSVHKFLDFVVSFPLMFSKLKAKFYDILKIKKCSVENFNSSIFFLELT